MKSDSEISRYKLFAKCLILSGFAIILIAFFLFSYKATVIDKDGLVKTDIFGNYGSLIGGTVGALWALAGVFLFYAALSLQREDLVAQKEEFQLTRKELATQNITLTTQRFENTFFHMVALHNDIVDKLSVYENKYMDEFKLAEKRNFFSHAVNNLLDQRGMLHDLKAKKPKTDKEQIEIIKTAYREFHFEYRMHLNHYFTNLYHIYKYIYFTDLITREEKYFYANLIRAQLSDNELILIFYNMFIEGLGYPNFKFLNQEYAILKNFDRNDFIGHYKLFIKDVVPNPFISRDGFRSA